MRDAALAGDELLLDTPLDTPIGAPRTPEDFQPLVTALGGYLDFPAMLAIADMLPVMVAYFDRDFRYRFINKPFAEWLGVPRKQILGRHSREIIGDKAFEERVPMIEQALKGQRTFFASEYDHPQRGRVAIQSDYLPWADHSGEVRGIIILVTDVTEHRVAERAIRESEARFRLIANSAPALMWVTRIDRVRDFVNQAYADFACGPGCDLEKARTLDWKERIHPDDVERIVAESIAGEASLQRFTLEGRYRRYDGEYRWLRTVSQPRFGPDGELVGFIGVGTDITLAKEAELELRRQVDEQTRELSDSEARFRAVFDTVLEVLVLMEPDGTVVELNRKNAPWRARNAREAVGTKIWDAPTLKNYPQHIPLMKKAVEQAAAGELFNEEVRLERDGSPTAFLDVSVQPVRDAEGKVIYLLFEGRDITE
jgi:PAS domain S-box-containing protein